MYMFCYVKMLEEVPHDRDNDTGHITLLKCIIKYFSDYISI